jgi:radical SAM superfamily enzyme YgiQ (UPF0313 family)
MMHVTFIKPTLGYQDDEERFVDEARMEPLSLAILAGLTPPGVDCQLIDDRIDVINYDEPTDLVAITIETFTARRAYEIAAEYRARRVPVVMGGMHATLIPDEVARHADSVYTGDGEALWPQVVADAHQGKLRPHYDGHRGIPQPGITPRRDLYAGKRYLPVSLIQFGRGCFHNCEFCAVAEFFDHRQCTRPVAEVLAEVITQNRRDLFFVDDNFTADPEATKDLLRALIPLKIRWVSQVSVDHTKDDELMRLFVESGCLGNVIGFESLNPGNLKRMCKTPNLDSLNGYVQAIQTLRNHHMQTWAAFTLGHDHDTVESILETCEWGISNKFTFAAFNILMPYPATPLYQRLQAEDRLLYDGRWWIHPDYRFNHAVFRPARMTPDELTEAAWSCRRRWSSYASIFKRALDPQTNLASPLRFATYAIYNPLFRREAFKRQGLRLGIQ